MDLRLYQILLFKYKSFYKLPNIICHSTELDFYYIRNAVAYDVSRVLLLVLCEIGRDVNGNIWKPRKPDLNSRLWIVESSPQWLYYPWRMFAGFPHPQIHIRMGSNDFGIWRFWREWDRCWKRLWFESTPSVKPFCVEFYSIYFKSSLFYLLQNVLRYYDHQPRYISVIRLSHLMPNSYCNLPHRSQVLDLSIQFIYSYFLQPYLFIYTTQTCEVNYTMVVFICFTKRVLRVIVFMISSFNRH